MHGQFTKEKIELRFKSSSQGQVHKNQHAGMIPYERTNQIHCMCVHQRKTDALNTEMGEKNLVSSEKRINFRLESAGTPSSPSSSVASNHPALASRVVFPSFWHSSSAFYFVLHTSSLCPSFLCVSLRDPKSLHSLFICR